MSKRKIKIGDVVRLNSDSPPMTVEALHDNGDVGCVWFRSAENLTDDLPAAGPFRDRFPSRAVHLEREDKDGMLT